MEVRKPTLNGFQPISVGPALFKLVMGFRPQVRWHVIEGFIGDSRALKNTTMRLHSGELWLIISHLNPKHRLYRNKWVFEAKK